MNNKYLINSMYSTFYSEVLFLQICTYNTYKYEEMATTVEYEVPI